ESRPTVHFPISHVPISTNISQSCCPCYSHALTLIWLTSTHFLLMRRCPTLIPDTGTAPLHLSCFYLSLHHLYILALCPCMYSRCTAPIVPRTCSVCLAASLPQS